MVYSYTDFPNIFMVVKAHNTSENKNISGIQRPMTFKFGSGIIDNEYNFLKSFGGHVTN